MDTAQNIIDEVETTSAKRRGRTKSDVFFYGVKEGKIEELKIAGTSQWTVQDAQKSLKDKIGQDAEILGPFYKVRSVSKLSDKSQLQVRLDLSKLNFTESLYTGNHDNWCFTAKGIAACEVDDEKFEDDDLVFIEYTHIFDDSVKTRKPRNGGRIVVRKDLLDEVVEE